MHSDTENLLKECNAGCKTAVDSLRLALTHTKSRELREILQKYYDRHAEIGGRTRQILNNAGCSGREPHAMARAMTRMSSGIGLSLSGGDGKVAALMYKGCAMGIRSVAKYRNEYEQADEESRGIAEEIIAVETEMERELLPFL